MRRVVRSTMFLAFLVFAATLLFGCEEVTSETFEVTFDADNQTTPVVVEVEEGDTVDEPDEPVKEGYAFDAWYSDDSAYDFATPVTADITLIARYTEVIDDTEYTVSFDSRGGTPIEPETVTNGMTVTEPDPPVKDDFSFEGWIYDGDTYDFDTPVTEDIELYAEYTYVGIPDSPDYEGRAFNPDFDQLIEDFSSGTLSSDDASLATIDPDQPYVSAGYSRGIGSDPDGALWKQAGSENESAAVYQYLVLRLRGFAGASVEDLALGFRLDDNHEVLVVPFTDTLDPDLENNERELDDDWHNYVISITDTLDGLEFVGKPGHTNVAASGLLAGFHLMNASEFGSGVLEIKDAYYSKVPNPIYPYEGSDYAQNKNYWSGTVGKVVESYLTIEPAGFYGEYLREDVNPDHTHVVLSMKQESPGIMAIDDLSLALIFADGSESDPVSLATVEGLPDSLGSSWLNLTIPFTAVHDGEDVVAGYKLFNDADVSVSIGQSFLSYLGEYEDVSYPVLDLEDVLIYDGFDRETIGTTGEWTADNPVAIDNGFTYLISYSGLYESTIGDGCITFDSTGGDFVSYKVHSTEKANQNAYRYLVLKYRLNDGGTLDDLRMAQLDFDDQPSSVIYANQWKAGLGLSSIPEDMSSYPYREGEWTYLIVDLALTEGYSTDFAGFDLYYTGSSLSLDAVFFANPISELDPDSEFLWATFEDLDLGTAQDKISSNQYWANVYDTPTTIVADGDDNQALELDGSEYAQYHTSVAGTGRYLAFDLKIETPGEVVSFRVGPTDGPLWAKDGQLILENGAPMVVNTDGSWHRYVIDWVASGLEPTDTIAFHASDGEVYRLDNISWYEQYPYFDDELVWGTWEGRSEGDANGQYGSDQYWAWNYGTASSFVEREDNMLLELDSSEGYVQYHTAVMAVPDYIAFDLTVEATGSLGVNVGGVHRWNEDLIGPDGNPIVLPDEGETGRVVIDVVRSGLPLSDEFGIQANDGAILLVDNLSFQWNEKAEDRYPVLQESYDETPVNDGETYWWGEWQTVEDGTVQLVTDTYIALRFGSPLIANARYLTFEVRLAAENDADTFRLELGDGNFVTYQTLIDDEMVPALTEDPVTVTVDMADYVADLSALEVLGFHIDEGGVIIDDLVVSTDAIGYQMSLFDDTPA
ncbi:MAG: InlB B-repeat-containing protein [Acholeplasmataceae bacterium]